ncbi:CHAT domain-containing protein [Flavitalea sp.]|nr:CHAT domain-containing protein [Flavitalea sp.]
MKRIINYIWFLATFLLSNPASSQSLSVHCIDSDCILQQLSADSARSLKNLSKWISIDSAISHTAIQGTYIQGRVQRMISVIYYDKGEYKNAIEWAEKVRVLFRKMMDEKEENLVQLAKNFYLMVACYDSLDQYPMQMNMVDSCISVDKEMNTSYYNTSLLIEEQVAWLYNKGDYRACISYADLGEAIIKKYVHDNSSFHRATSIIFYKVQAHMYLGELQVAQEILHNTLKEHEKLRTIGLLGTLQGINADLYLLRNKPDSAIASLLIAIENHRKEKYAKGLAECYEIIGQTHLEYFNRPDLCLKYSKLALRYAVQIDSVSILNTMSKAYLKANNPNLALQYIDKASSLLGVDIPNIKEMPGLLLTFALEKRAPYAIQLLISTADVYLRIGMLYKDRRSLNTAIDFYARADQLLSRLKNEYRTLDSKLYWRKQTVYLYERAIESSYLLDDKTAALYFLEKSRAILLQDQISETRAMQPAELKIKTTIRAEIKALNDRISQTNRDDPAYTALQRRVLELEQKEYLLRLPVTGTESLMHDHRLAIESAAALKTVKKILETHQAYINIFDGDSAVYLLKFIGHKILFQKIAKKSYDCLVAEFQQGLIKPEVYTDAFEKWSRNANALYKLVFGHDEISPGRIMISPGSNHYPFEALVKTTTNGQNRYLVQDYAISYVYSAAYLADSSIEAKSISNPQLLGVAPVQYSGRLNVSELAGSDLSVRNLAEGFKYTSMFSNAATKKNFLDNFYKYEIVHLYTHADARGQRADPVIYFADSLLYLNDVMVSVRPVTLLIVLAACESGLGQFYKGEGVFSFNRAFAAIGIPTSIVNLWPVDSKTTYQLNELFYQLLRKGLPVDVALQQAKLKYLETATGEKVMPYFWAGSLVEGKPLELLPLNSKFAMVVGIAIFFTLLIALLAIIALRFQRE